MQAFQTTKKYNSILFILYFKGFELLRTFLLKHNPGVNLENVDFKAINKEMEADKAAEDVVMEIPAVEGEGLALMEEAARMDDLVA